MLGQKLSSPIFPPLCSNFVQKLASEIYKYLVLSNYFQINSSLVIGFLLTYLQHFQAVYYKQKGLCDKQSYKYQCLVRRRKDHLNKYWKVEDSVLILVFKPLIGQSYSLQANRESRAPPLPSIKFYVFTILDISLFWVIMFASLKLGQKSF